MSARLAGLYIYPLKGGRGVPVDRWETDGFGLRFDRRWMVVDADRQAITQRDRPRLALLEATPEPDALVLRADGASPLVLPLSTNGAQRLEVSVWNDVAVAIDMGDDAARWISDALELCCRLVHMPEDVVRPVSLRHGLPGDRIGFADAYPFLLISQGALDELNRRLDQPVPMNRFRPNLVIDGVEPHAEDFWTRITIGGMPFDVVKPCARCAVPTIDQATAERGKEPIRTLSTYRRVDGKVMFGQNVIHRGTGELRVGDTVAVLASR
ncbi:MAG: MOSC domain-containing protein [Longimicrobiales bacterium]